jgi:hypothetical protein
MIGGAGHVIDGVTQLLFPGVPTINQFTLASLNARPLDGAEEQTV